MRFKYLGELMLGMQTYGTITSGYQFIIVYDKKLDVYSASWKNEKYNNKYAIMIGENIHPIAKQPYFDKMIDAERACQQMLKQLKQQN